MTEPLPLGPLNLATAFALVVLSMGLARALRLGLTGELLWAAARTTAQLLLVGYALSWIFAVRSPWPVALAFAVMLGTAVWTAIRRGGPIPGLAGATTLALGLGSGATCLVVTAFVVRVRPWWEPRYVLPLAGMIIGNAMNAAALTAERLRSELRLRRDEVEELLCLGASRYQAVEGVVRDTVRAAMLPTINSMLVVGLVSLPGMMTGQILAGGDPNGAARYQIVVMFMLCAATTLSTALLAALLYRRFFTAALQLRHDLLASPPARK